MINHYAPHPHSGYTAGYGRYSPSQGYMQSVNPESGYGYSHGYGYSQMSPSVPASGVSSPGRARRGGQGERQPLFNFTNTSFLKGAAIGAATAYLLSNEAVQQSLIKSSVRLWMSLQGGVEEMKERFRDAEAEIQAEQK
ncbi:MAG: hypothetical protein CSA50_04975 [Gammaproteobacteria bacterium]|nr:MAG: hypothetical protein CSA50_04975 [Gammaproteobacteria bacterium]